jgi:hypothetical protein
MLTNAIVDDWFVSSNNSKVKLITKITFITIKRSTNYLIFNEK